VQTDLAAQAKAAGFQQVMPRSQFTTQLPKFLPWLKIEMRGLLQPVLFLLRFCGGISAAQESSSRGDVSATPSGPAMRCETSSSPLVSHDETAFKKFLTSRNTESFPGSQWPLARS